MVSKIHPQDTAAELCPGRSLDIMASQRKALPSHHHLNAGNGWGEAYRLGISLPDRDRFCFCPSATERRRLGAVWLDAPSLTLGLLAGGLTLFAPFIILQPALGFGIAASQTPRPSLARLLSVLTHLAWGFGLYIAALAIRAWE